MFWTKARFNLKQKNKATRKGLKYLCQPQSFRKHTTNLEPCLASRQTDTRCRRQLVKQAICVHQRNSLRTTRYSLKRRGERQLNQRFKPGRNYSRSKLGFTADLNVCLAPNAGHAIYLAFLPRYQHHILKTGSRVGSICFKLSRNIFVDDDFVISSSPAHSQWSLTWLRKHNFGKQRSYF